MSATDPAAALADLLDGLYAFDIGSTDSGISDPVRREEARTGVGRLTSEQKTHIARGLYGGSDYTDEDVREFLEWMDEI